MIRKELQSLLDHDNAKYPLDKKLNKEKKKSVKRSANGSAYVPEIDDFLEDELKEADSLIEEEVRYLHLAMGHENQSLDEFVEAHKTCLNISCTSPPVMLMVFQVLRETWRNL